MATAAPETPYSALPLPDANEYPYNLQGDQTKARALASAAQNGAKGALEQLRTLGLDQNANLVAAPTAPAPAAPTPAAYRPTSPSRPAAQPAQPSANYDRYKGANTDALVKEYKDGYGSAQDRAALRAEIERRATRLKDPAAAQAIGMAGAGGNAAQSQPQPGQPSYSRPAGPAGSPQASNYQSPRTVLQDQAQAGRINPEQLKSEAAQAVGGIAPNSPAAQQRERDFQESKRRFDEQTAMAKQRMQFEQEMARTREARSRQNAKEQAANQPAQTAGGRAPAAKGPASGAKADDKKKGGSKPSAKGGGGGSRYAKSPEQKAREKAREARQANRERQAENRRGDDRWARGEKDRYGRNYRDYADMERDQKRQKFFNQGKESNQGISSDQGKGSGYTAEQQRGLDGLGYKGGRPYNYNTGEYIDNKTPSGQAGSSSSATDTSDLVPGGYRMTHAYGNKHAKLVRARGDLA